jgi:signal transduction histidine kinase
MISQANKSLQKLNRLVSDLLNTSRIASGKLELRKNMFRPVELARDCCNHVRNEGKYQTIVEGDPSLELLADEQKIDQVLVNLVNNAVKYAPDSKTIHINVRQEGLFAKITVKDAGPGIAAEHLPHLFERYYRSDTYNTSGLGLGLYICAEIIRHHGGQIGVDTEPGKGSSFWFTLPLAGPL